MYVIRKWPDNVCGISCVRFQMDAISCAGNRTFMSRFGPLWSGLDASFLCSLTVVIHCHIRSKFFVNSYSTDRREIRNQNNRCQVLDCLGDVWWKTHGNWEFTTCLTITTIALWPCKRVLITFETSIRSIYFLVYYLCILI